MIKKSRIDEEQVVSPIDCGDLSSLVWMYPLEWAMIIQDYMHLIDKELCNTADVHIESKLQRNISPLCLPNVMYKTWHSQDEATYRY